MVAGGLANSVVIAVLLGLVACVTGKCRGPLMVCVEHGLFESLYEAYVMFV